MTTDRVKLCDLADGTLYVGDGAEKCQACGSTEQTVSGDTPAWLDVVCAGCGKFVRVYDAY